MPRIIIDYSNNVTEPVDQVLFHLVHDYFIASGRFSIEDLKSRAIAHDQFLIGDGNTNNAFISIQLKIMEGRDEDFRKKLSVDVLAIAEQYFQESIKNMNLNLTCFVTEIQKSTYSKLKQ